MARYKPTNRDQLVMLPVSLEQLVDEEHLSRKIYYLLDSSLIDLGDFEKEINNDESGALAYHPKHLLAILLYAYITGVRSSRVIERKCHEDLAYMYLCEFQKPDHTTIANFRTKFGDAFESVFSQTIFLGIESGLIDFKHIASDGTKMDGAGSRNQIVKGDKIDSRIEKYEALSRKIIKEAEQVDKLESKDKIKKKIRKYELKLEKLYKAKRKYDLAKSGVKDEKLRYHLTEHEAKLLKDKDGYHSGYNCQTSVDSKSQMILEKRVTQSENDSNEGLITHKSLIDKYGKSRLSGSTLSFDNGYHNQELIKLDGEDDIQILVSQKKEGKQISEEQTSLDNFKYESVKDIFICPAGKELTFKQEKTFSGGRLMREYKINGCGRCHLKDGCFKKETKNKRQKSKIIESNKIDLRETFEAYQEKMNQQEVIEEYRKRMSTVEPVYAHMTSHKKSDRFHVWGLFKAGIEFTIMCISHNLLKLLKYGDLEQLEGIA